MAAAAGALREREQPVVGLVEGERDLAAGAKAGNVRAGIVDPAAERRRMSGRSCSSRGNRWPEASWKMRNACCISSVPRPTGSTNAK